MVDIAATVFAATAGTSPVALQFAIDMGVPPVAVVPVVMPLTVVPPVTVPPILTEMFESGCYPRPCL